MLHPVLQSCSGAEILDGNDADRFGSGSPELHLSLVIQFQSELDLPRIVGSIACRTDLAKSRTGEIAGTGDRHNTVSAEIGCVEVWMVDYVKEFSAELQHESLAQSHVLERGEVQPLERWSGNLVRRTADCRQRAGQSCARRRLAERRGISKEAQLPVRIDMESSFRILTGDDEVVAITRAPCGRGNGVAGTIQRNGLAAFQHGASVDAPPPERLAGIAAVVQEAFIFSKGKLIASAQVKDVANIERSQTVVVVDAEP